MRVEVKVTCHPDGHRVQSLRTLFCIESKESRVEDYNPLIETSFNDLLDEIVQEAFLAGRQYEENKSR